MRLASLVPARWRKLAHEALKFGIVGGVNTVINFAVFNLLILTIFSNGQLKANVVATVVATTMSYFLNRHWTYRDRPRSAMRREYLLFFVFNATGLAIELAVLGATKYGLGLTSIMAVNVAKALGVGLGTIFRFWSYRTFVFRPAPATAEPATGEAGATAASSTAASSAAAGSAARPPAPSRPAGDEFVPAEDEFVPTEAELIQLETEFAAEMGSASAKP